MLQLSWCSLQLHGVCQTTVRKLCRWSLSQRERSLQDHSSFLAVINLSRRPISFLARPLSPHFLRRPAVVLATRQPENRFAFHLCIPPEPSFVCSQVGPCDGHRTTSPAKVVCLVQTLRLGFLNPAHNGGKGHVGQRLATRGRNTKVCRRTGEGYEECPMRHRKPPPGLLISENRVQTRLSLQGFIWRHEDQAI